MELRDKLELALRARAGPAPGATAPPPVPRRLPPDLQRIETGRGPVYLTEERWPLTHRHGRLRLRDALSLDPTALSRLAPGLDARELAGAAFVDVETTGLAGGTGTYVFLVGIGTFEDGCLRLRQFFLAHLSGETAMLSAVSEILANCGAIVSFNGRRFDLPLLETRLTLGRLPRAGLGLPHVDLLYPARRLYRRRLASCQLSFLEEAVLGVQRGDDLPGWAMPGVYFDYVRGGRAELLSAVFCHNAQDILSLVALLGHLGRLIGGVPPADPGDCLALARWDESEGRLESAVRLYEAALDGGVAEGARSTAFPRLARLYRRLQRWSDLGCVLRACISDGISPAAKLDALVELAKFEEHRRRDYPAAEALTRRALSLVDVMVLRGGVPPAASFQREALQHRLWRLQRRTASAPR